MEKAKSMLIKTRMFESFRKSKTISAPLWKNKRWSNWKFLLYCHHWFWNAKFCAFFSLLSLVMRFITELQPAETKLKAEELTEVDSTCNEWWDLGGRIVLTQTPIPCSFSFILQDVLFPIIKMYLLGNYRQVCKIETLWFKTPLAITDSPW